MLCTQEVVFINEFFLTKVAIQTRCEFKIGQKTTSSHRDSNLGPLKRHEDSNSASEKPRSLTIAIISVFLYIGYLSILCYLFILLLDIYIVFYHAALPFLGMYLTTSSFL